MKNLKIAIFLIAILCFLLHAKAEEVKETPCLPFNDYYPLYAPFDLDRTSGKIKDFTGWTGTAHTPGHAYDGYVGTDYSYNKKEGKKFRGHHT